MIETWQECALKSRVYRESIGELRTKWLLTKGLIGIMQAKSILDGCETRKALACEHYQSRLELKTLTGWRNARGFQAKERLDADKALEFYQTHTLARMHSQWKAAYSHIKHKK